MKLIPKGSLRTVILITIAVGVHAAFCLSLRYHFLNHFFYIAMHAKGQGGCFFGAYQAGVNLLNGESIYGCETYRTPSEIAVPFYHFYRYLPFTSYVTSLFSKLLKPWPAYWLWILVNEIILVACIVLTLRLRNRFGRAAIIAASLWLLYSPFYAELYMGQFCFVMTFFIFLIIYPYLKGAPIHGADYPGAGNPGSGNPGSDNPRHANPGSGNPGTGNPGRVHLASDDPHSDKTGAPPRTIPAAWTQSSGFRQWISWCSWILSVLLKSFTALYSLTFFRMGKKKLALAGIAAAVITSVPYFVMNPQDLRWFLHLNFQPIPSFSVGGCLGFSSLLRDMSDRFFSSAGTHGINLFICDVSYCNVPLLIVLAGILITTILLTVRTGRIDPLSNITLWTLTFFLVFKDIWEYHYVMLLPLFVGFYLRTRSKFLLVLFVLLAVPTPFFLYDVPGSEHPQAYWSTPLSIMHHSFKAVPTLLFYLWVARGEIARAGGLRRIFAPATVR
jgi:hypothetical protein